VRVRVKTVSGWVVIIWSEYTIDSTLNCEKIDVFRNLLCSSLLLVSSIDVITLQDDPFHRVRGQIESRGLRVTCAWYLLLFDILQCIKAKGAGDGRNETDFDFGETLTDSYEDHYRYLREFVKMQMLTQRVILHTDIIQDDGSVIEDSARTLELNPDCRDIDRSLSLPTIRIHMSVRNENNELKVMGYMTLESDHIVDEQYLMSPDLFDGNKLKMF
jgi:hypothetical protein